MSKSNLRVLFLLSVVIFLLFFDSANMTPVRSFSDEIKNIPSRHGWEECPITECEYDEDCLNVLGEDTLCNGKY